MSFNTVEFIAIIDSKFLRLPSRKRKFFLQIFLNLTSIIANECATIGNIIDLDFKAEDIKIL